MSHIAPLRKVAQKFITLPAIPNSKVISLKTKSRLIAHQGIIQFGLLAQFFFTKRSVFGWEKNALWVGVAYIRASNNSFGGVLQSWFAL